MNEIQIAYGDIDANTLAELRQAGEQIASLSDESELSPAAQALDDLGGDVAALENAVESINDELGALADEVAAEQVVDGAIVADVGAVRDSIERLDGFAATQAELNNTHRRLLDEQADKIANLRTVCAIDQWQANVDGRLGSLAADISGLRIHAHEDRQRLNNAIDRVATLEQQMTWLRPRIDDLMARTATTEGGDGQS